MKAWVVDQRNQGAVVTTKQIIFEAKVRATAKGHDDFFGNEGWCYRFMKRNGLAMRTKTKISQKMPMAYDLEGTEDDLLYEGNDSSSTVLI